jgi:diaminohydroxyphosphoribosylaminopyrimidine deaminase / 5-amino-6-(5-phosphoribosylamino)uracil reductase
MASCSSVTNAAEAPPMISDEAWPLLLCARALTPHLDPDQPYAFAAHGPRALRRVGDDSGEALLRWLPARGWVALLPADDPRTTLFDLYLPLCSATATRPVVVGHLGQSVDGFIATHSGDSQFVTGHQNIVHLHRLRALCDAVIVGPGTVAADNPQLTTRLVDGPNPLRVVYDARRRLSGAYKLFDDDAAPTIYATDADRLADAPFQLGRAEVLALDGDGSGGTRRALLDALRARGCARIFIEGGGVTVSAFLEDGLLDRLHVAIAPVLIGDGRPAIRLAPPLRLRDCARPAYRVYRMGGDVLFDFDLRGSDAEPAVAPESVTRML